MERCSATLAPGGTQTASPSEPRRLHVVVPYTTQELTQAALRSVTLWARNLDATVWLIRVHVVPYPCPLDRPLVDRDHLRRQLTAAAKACVLPLRVRLMYARDREEALRRLPRRGCVVVLATRKRWWRTAEEKLARSLSRAGQSVALVTV